MHVDPHLLRTFTTVVRRGSFSAAAAELGYTQSAVSQHIAALEHDLGVSLLGRRPVAPTSAGDRLLDHATPLLLRLDAARADVRRAAAPPPERVVVAASPLAAPAAVAEVRGALHVVTRAEVVAGVATGEFDVGFVDGVVAPSDPLRLPVGVKASVVTEHPLVVALPPGHPLARRKGLRLDDLVDARWIDAPDAAVPLEDLREAVGTAGFHAATAYRGTDTATLRALVAAGHGLAVLPGTDGAPLLTPNLVHRVERLRLG
ncbi:LysR family transcriptional regulator [Saccharothrix sp. NPDC042600]|uniref:LysR family transcriptional regulator n=1 Tax=Saccharothrix TaxID=2071 RepID=UPI003407E8EC|nr:LysR family transcriptional regulator [Saccharothrix mutabilis subsp. capreolus]